MRAWIRIVLNCIIYAALISPIWLLSMQPQISKLTIQFVFWTTHKFHFIHRKIRAMYQKSLWNTENGLKTSFDEYSLKWMEIHDFFVHGLESRKTVICSMNRGPWSFTLNLISYTCQSYFIPCIDYQIRFLQTIIESMKQHSTGTVMSWPRDVVVFLFNKDFISKALFFQFSKLKLVQS